MKTTEFSGTSGGLVTPHTESKSGTIYLNENTDLKNETNPPETEKTGLIVKVCRDGSPIPFSNSKMDYYAGAIIEYINAFGSCPQIGLRINFEDFDVIYIKKISFNHTAITFYLHSEV